MISFTQKIEKDEDGNLIVIIPDEILEELGWSEGDELYVTPRVNGVIELAKKVE